MIATEPRIRNEDLGTSEISDRALKGDIVSLKVHQISDLAKCVADDVHTTISYSKDYHHPHITQIQLL